MTTFVMLGKPPDYFADRVGVTDGDAIAHHVEKCPRPRVFNDGGFLRCASCGIPRPVLELTNDRSGQWVVDNWHAMKERRARGEPDPPMTLSTEPVPYRVKMDGGFDMVVSHRRPFKPMKDVT